MLNPAIRRTGPRAPLQNRSPRGLRSGKCFAVAEANRSQIHSYIDQTGGSRKTPLKSSEDIKAWQGPPRERTLSTMRWHYTRLKEHRFSSSSGGCKTVRSMRARFLCGIRKSAHARNALRTRQGTRWRRLAAAFAKVVIIPHSLFLIYLSPVCFSPSPVASQVRLTSPPVISLSLSLYLSFETKREGAWEISFLDQGAPRHF